MVKISMPLQLMKCHPTVIMLHLDMLDIFVLAQMLSMEKGHHEHWDGELLQECLK